MLGKRAQPMIGKISKLLVSSNHAVFLDVSTTPRSTLELKLNSPSPRPKKSFDTNNGVGLGILAALEKSEENRSSEILARHAMSSPRPILTDPISCGRVRASYEDSEADSFQSSDYLTHDQTPKNEPFTRTTGNDFDKKIAKQSIFSVSICQDDTTNIDFRMSDFLSKCNLCKKKLHGKDIYMYRGERAFCSADCRERHIIIEDRKEQWRSEAARSVDVSSYGQENIYSTGILAI